MAGNQQVVKELLSSQTEQQVKITRGVRSYRKYGETKEDRVSNKKKLKYYCMGAVRFFFYESSDVTSISEITLTALYDVHTVTIIDRHRLSRKDCQILDPKKLCCFPYSS